MVTVFKPPHTHYYIRSQHYSYVNSFYLSVTSICCNKTVYYDTEVGIIKCCTCHAPIFVPQTILNEIDKREEGSYDATALLLRLKEDGQLENTPNQTRTVQNWISCWYNIRPDLVRVNLAP